jgi:hypothetical protein
MAGFNPAIQNHMTKRWTLALDGRVKPAHGEFEIDGRSYSRPRYSAVSPLWSYQYHMDTKGIFQRSRKQ